MACSDQVSTQDLENALKDAITLGEVATSKAGAVSTGAGIDTSTNRFGETTDTVKGRLDKMGYAVPVAYTAGISFSASDNVKTVDNGSVVYAPLPSSLPFTTTGVWATDSGNFFVVQGLTNESLINDLSQHYEFETVSAYKGFTGEFPVGKTIKLLDRNAYFSVISGTGTANTFNIIGSASVSQSIALQRNTKNSFTPKQFGFPTDGVTDCHPAWLAYLASGISYFDWDDGIYSLSSFVQITSNSTHNFAGTTLKTTGSSKLLRAGFANDWAVTGNLTLQGTGDGSGEATEDSTILFELEDNKRWTVENVTCLDSLGKGFYFKGNSASRAEKGRMSNCYSYRCQRGWDMEANGSTEYNTHSNCGAVSNFIGARIGSGNIRWIGGVITDNARNVELIAGDNHLHGKMIGVAINHATAENMLATDVVNGFGFVGCDFYGDSAFAGRITLNNSQGINISGGLMNCRLQIEAGAGTITGTNSIVNMTIAGSFSSFQGDLTRLVTYGHTGLGGIDANAFNRQQETALTLLGTWAGSASFSYNPATNIVSLTGTVSGGSALDISTIPAGFRPNTDFQFPIDASGAYGAVTIAAATGIVSFAVGSNSAVRLNGVSWQAWQ